MKTAVVFRFSAMGDVALTMGTLATVLKYRPDLKIIMVTRKKFAPFFANNPRIEVFPCDFEGEHKGPRGLIRLFKQLRQYRPHDVLDLHQNLRTRFLKALFRLSGKRVFSLDKHRAEKKQIIAGRRHTPVKHVCEQYLDVFKAAGIVENTVHIENLTPLFRTSEAAQRAIDHWIQDEDAIDFIGMAPFAQHKGKIWSLDHYEKLIERLQEKFPGRKILLFGGGPKEKKALENVARKYSRAQNLAGLFSLEEELELISRAAFFISGDSSNMHFAAMMGVKVISIWGATHTLTGFAPLFQPDKNKVEISRELLTCRPCSVYGKEPCRRGDYACLTTLEPEQVIRALAH
ncbi:MAG: glycosyltransferase family 9 protein [Leadbetterella sp.]|nr:glycosyltransferase family 9 protein [Leadbetterella sp.]